MGEHRTTFRGYIAMLVVVKPYRGRGIGNFYFEIFALEVLILVYLSCCFDAARLIPVNTMNFLGL